MADKLRLTWRDRCQCCGRLCESTRRRTYRSKNYTGPCGDSFCYASCEMDACRETTATICDRCEKKQAKP